MEPDDTLQPEDIYDYIESSYIPEIIMIMAIVVTVGYLNHLTLHSNDPTRREKPYRAIRLPAVEESIMELSSRSRKQSRKPQRKMLDLRTRRTRSREYILGRPVKIKYPKMMDLRCSPELSYLCTRSGAKYSRASTLVY